MDFVIIYLNLKYKKNGTWEYFDVSMYLYFDRKDVCSRSSKIVTCYLNSPYVVRSQKTSLETRTKKLEELDTL